MHKNKNYKTKMTVKHSLVDSAAYTVRIGGEGYLYLLISLTQNRAQSSIDGLSK